MPTVSIYTTSSDSTEQLKSTLPKLRDYIALKLSCSNRTLAPNEISIRVMSTTLEEMIAPIEIEITAHHYRESVESADRTCLSIRDFIKEQIPSIPDVRVWLVLAELGHSWEE